MIYHMLKYLLIVNAPNALYFVRAFFQIQNLKSETLRCTNINNYMRRKVRLMDQYFKQIVGLFRHPDNDNIDEGITLSNRHLARLAVTICTYNNIALVYQDNAHTYLFFPFVCINHGVSQY